MKSTPTLPLLHRSMDSVLARRDGTPITTAAFLAHCQELAGRLPELPRTLNLVADRTLFQIAFCAILLRGHCNLLPPNPNPAIQLALACEHGPACVVHDGQPVAAGLEELLLPSLGTPAPSTGLPSIAADHLASISFTSGSTGQASPIRRSWRMLYQGALVNRNNLLPDTTSAYGMVATVPAQHMFGLEMSVLLPLVSDLCVHPGRPVYPADVVTALEQVPAPRLLLSTPLHLRALLDSGLQFPVIEQVITATAPLDSALAMALEKGLKTRVVDVYGCSEVGCIARREPAREAWWRAFPEFRFEHLPGGDTRIDADHADQPFDLQDRLAFAANGSFTLAGRLADQVNIAGKRGSLAELTQLLVRTPGVTDGQVFEPAAGDRVGRLAGLYCGTATPREVLDFMRREVDSVLLPRPLLQVAHLPRNALGKLPRAALLEALAQARQATRPGEPG